MRLREARGRDEPELNLTSLIDVVLLLLIFFMLTTTFIKPEQISIRLPEADSRAASPAGRRGLEITVTAGGEFLVNGRALVDSRPQTLEAAIRLLKPELDGRQVVISADGRAAHQAVVTVMDVAARLGYVDVRIRTTRPTAVQ